MDKPSTIKRPWLGFLSIVATAFAIFEGRFGEPCLGSLFVWLSGSAIGFILALVALIVRQRPGFAAVALAANVVAVILSFCL